MFDLVVAVSVFGEQGWFFGSSFDGAGLASAGAECALIGGHGGGAVARRRGGRPDVSAPAR